MDFKQFQQLIRDLYYKKDKERGSLGTFTWLVEEIGEVADIIRRKEIDKAKLGSELADVVAWTFSLANIHGIDLEKAVFEKYPNSCTKCGKNPCNCKE